MFSCKTFYVCALVGVLIKRLYEMHGAAIKIKAVRYTRIFSLSVGVLLYLYYSGFKCLNTCIISPISSKYRNNATLLTFSKVRPNTETAQLLSAAKYPSNHLLIIFIAIQKKGA